MTDWQKIKDLILEESEPILRPLIQDNESKGEGIAAVGFVFEFGRGELCFSICANTVQNAEEITEYCRWNSGDFDYPAGVEDHYGGFSAALWGEMNQLDRLAEVKADSEMIHERVGEICCEVLAELAARGVFGDWSAVDFNVTALLGDEGEVKKRDAQIRRLIASSG